jgi:RNA polymerase sigma-70 factor (ECF subfamily)
MDESQPDSLKTDEALMEMLQGGDATAFDLLVLRYQKPVVNYLYRLTGNWALAEDLAQEAFLTLYNKGGQFQLHLRFRSWFYKIVTNLHRYEHRKRKRLHTQQLAFRGEEGSAEQSVADTSSDPATQTERNELQSQMRNLVRALPEKQRVAVVLHVFQGLSYKEIASVVGCRVGTVRSRIHYGLKRLKERIIASDLLSGER